MESTDKTPPVPQELIAHLEETFPRVEINPDMTVSDIMFEAGIRSVVEVMKTWRKWREEEGILD